MKTYDYVVAHEIYELCKKLNGAEDISNEFGFTNTQINITTKDNYFYGVFKRIKKE